MGLSQFGSNPWGFFTPFGRVTCCLLPRPHSGQQIIAAVYVELTVDVVQVSLDGRQGDEQLAGDIRVAFPLNHLQNDLPLPFGDVVLRQEGLRQGIHSQRGRGRMLQEIGDQEGSVQGIGNRADQKTGIVRECDCRGAQGREEVENGFQVPDCGKDQQADQEVTSLRLPGTAQQPIPERQGKCKGDEVPQGGDPVASPKSDGPCVRVEHRAKGGEDQQCGDEHQPQEADRDRPPVLDPVDARQEVDQRHNDGIPEHLLSTGEPIPRPGGVIFHVQGQVFLQHAGYEHQRKAGIQHAEIPQVAFPRAGCPENHDRQGSQPDHDHKQVVGDLEMFHEG